MKKVSKLFALAMTAAILAMCLCLPAMAAGEYTYRVTISTGGLEGAALNPGAVSVMAGGSFAGAAAVSADKIEITGIPYGTVLSLSGAVSAEGTRYATRGYVRSGQDYGAALLSLEVKGDTDVVAAYSVPGQQVAYMVEYLDEAGNALAESQTFYGTIGDKPVATYVYIDGYLPHALNLTKTLSANEAENVFAFIYTPVAAETVTAAAAGTETEEQAEPGGPQELINLDEDETPLASGAGMGGGPSTFAGMLGLDSENGRKGAVIGGSIAGLAVLLCAAAVIIMKRKKVET